jgi:Transposase IS66 family
MAPDLPDSLERLSHSDLIGAVRDLVGEFTRLRAEHEKVLATLAKLRIEHQAVKDELARYKKLPPRPPQKPSGMEKATDLPDVAAGGTKGERSTRRRGSNLDKLKINRTVVVPVAAPAGSRRKGYEEIVVQDLAFHPVVTCYRRERWETPDGQTLIAPLDPSIVGGYGPHLHRFVLMLHFQGQMTCERILALLNGAGVVISKRQVVRLLVAKLETFRAEDEEVLTAGLKSSRFVTVDDTGARHQGKSGFTTHIGSDRFDVFRTGPSKSRLAFLRNLLGGAARYVINEAALVYMRDNHLPQAALDKLASCATRVFPSDQDWMQRLSELGLTELTITPDPVRVASEGALWGALHEERRLGDLVIVSDGAGLPGLDPGIRVGVHAQCWVHAERLVHKLTPANPIQHKAVEVARRMIWWFYGKLKEYKLAPSPERAEILRAQFKRIFDRAKTGYAALDNLLRRLLRLEDRLMRVLERPEIPLHTNASENAIRCFVTKRKISGGTVSEKGRQSRDAMLGLDKTCKKLKIRFFDYLGARLGIKGPQIPRLASLVREAPS